jgi:tetratricopeptide (TPR) repeat protein/mono/diheme cytochrome c family protein
VLALLAALVLSGGAAAGPPASVTYAEHIAPLIDRHCAACHQPGGGAPFSLRSYDDVRRRARLVADVTARRQMPPWKAEPGPPFAGERRLTDDDVALIQEWVRQGSRPGGAPGPALTATAAAEAWQLGAPDVVLTLPAAYQLPADSPDVFRTFVLEVPIDRARVVRAFEFRSGATLAVHHASVKFDRTRSSRNLDDNDPAPGYEGGGSRYAQFPDGHFLSWTPGHRAQALPQGMGWTLDPEADLILEMHLTATGRVETITPSIGLYLTDTPPSILPMMLRLGSQTIDIAAGDSRYLVSDTFEVPTDVDIIAIQPHAHSLAREFAVFARLPTGDTLSLLTIRDWDVRWQDVYRFRDAVHLPAGSVLGVQINYDNSAINPRNPHRPPRRVTYGQSAGDEMGNVWVQLLASDQAARTRLEAAFAPKLLQDDIAGAEKAVQLTPLNPLLRSDLGLLYASVGRDQDGVGQLREAVRLAPSNAAAHYALGTLLLRMRQTSVGRDEFRRTLELDPQFAAAHTNLGVIAHAEGRLEEAMLEYEAALRLEPANVETLYNVGRVRATQRRFSEAVSTFRRALAHRPDDPMIQAGLGSALGAMGDRRSAVVLLRKAVTADPDLTSAMVDLAWLLASDARTSSDRVEAVRLAEAAADRTGYTNLLSLDTLALAYLAGARRADALRIAELALARALEVGEASAIEQARRRLTDIAER